MPMYEFRCDQCGSVSDHYMKMSEYQSFNFPQHCGEKMQRIISPPFVMPDINSYKSVVTGEMITSRSHHREHLKKHDLIEVGNEYPKPREIKPIPGLKQEIIKNMRGAKNV